MSTTVHTTEPSAPGRGPLQTPRRLSPALAMRLGPAIALVAMIAIFAALAPEFLTVANFTNILRESAVLLVLATAATFIILMGSIDLSVGSVVTISGLAGAMLLRDQGATWLVLLPLVGLGCGLVNGLLFAYARLPSFLVTLGTQFAFNGLALYLCNGTPVSVRPIGLADLVNGKVGPIPAISIWAIVILLVAVALARWTRFGRFMYVIGGGEQMASLAGVPVRRYKLYAFLLAGVLASLAGAMLMFRIGAGTPDMGETFLLTSIAAVVMGGTPLSGGVGGPGRTFLGVLIIAVLDNGMKVSQVDPFLQIVVQGVVVIAAVALTIDRRKLTLVK